MAHTTIDADIRDNSTADVNLDGIAYALLPHHGARWRIAATNPAWLEEIAAWPDPDESRMAQLAERGIWLAPEAPPSPLAVMCCGLGSVWPGMGAGLYDNFPAARLAMDRIAALADWDVLALMDETGLEKITQTRWQIPYLFMLEYAQWSQFVSLGLKPAMICGHSLGELVALCLAGVYSLEAAWHLLEIRAEHMAELEAGATRESGMLAISAPWETISEILGEYPGLHVSNSNTPRQYILSGPREALTAVRKSLRRQRVPAMLLNIDLAFHNPAMRILRDLSERRLNGLTMHPPAVPMLSCVTGAPYPDTRPEICRYITDLDENTVDWTGSVMAMRSKYGIDCFLELGPQETLCGLVREIDGSSACMASSAKGREADAMREVCARLFSLGHTSLAAIKKCRASRPTTVPATATAPPRPLQQPGDDVYRGIPASQVHAILNLIGSACHVEPASITPQMDLRHDLALRSSNFPFLVQEAEKLFDQTIELENLTQIVTVADLVFFLSGKQNDTPAQDGSAQARAASFLARCAPLERFVVENTSGALAPARLDPGAAVWPPNPLVPLCIFDETLAPDIWSGLAPLGGILAIPAWLLPKCGHLAEAGAEIVPLDCGPELEPDALAAALERLFATYGSPASLFLAPPPCDADDVEAMRNRVTLVADIFDRLAHRLPDERLCVLQRLEFSVESPAAPPALSPLREFAEKWADGQRRKYVCWLDERAGGELRNMHECGDMLALEILYGRAPFTVWKRWKPGATLPLRYCQAADILWPVFADASPPLPPQASQFQGLRQYSRFADQTLSSHGAEGMCGYGQKQWPGAPWLPVTAILEAVYDTSALLAPWLKVMGFSDIRLFEFPSLPPGVTRECRSCATLKPWLMLEGVFTRMSMVTLAARGISTNGRHMRDYEPVCDALCFLAASVPPPPPVWDSGTGQGAWCMSSQKVFYDALGLGQPWRQLVGWRRFGLSGDDATPGWEFLLDLGGIARKKIWDYKHILYIIESALLGGLEAIALEENGGESLKTEDVCGVLKKWRPATIGFIRFGPGNGLWPETAAMCLQLRQSWRNERIVRYDAQAAIPGHSPILTMHHLEFART